MLKLFNSLSGKKEILTKSKKSLKLFVCGPTVYDYSHIGHARTYIVFDVMTKYLRSQGFDVFYLQNITDVDDKIIERARRQNKNPLAVAKFFEKKYLKDIKKIGITAVNRYACASDFIPQIVKQIAILIKKGYAYKIEGSGYYFNIAKFPRYGHLSKRTVQQAEDAVSRIDENIAKRNRGDFCLWKFSNYSLKADLSGKKFAMINGEPLWNTTLGWGRPGWHIEDTAITEKHFGPQYDLHGGAAELKFPHHESEIAQQEAASGKRPFVKIWLHTGLLLIDGKKMSKSLGNFITIKDFLKKYPPDILRLLIISHHYRSPINYNKKIIEQTKNSLNTIKEFLDKLSLAQKLKRKNAPLKIEIQNYRKLFDEAMADDFNTPQALAIIFNLISILQNNVWQLTPKQIQIIRKLIKNQLKTLGLEIKAGIIPQKIRALAAQREKFRINKQFIQSDALRKQIERLGYKVEDTAAGPLIMRNSKPQITNYK